MVPGSCGKTEEKKTQKKGFWISPKASSVSTGRDEKIRTSDPLNPIQVRYQAALHPDPDSNLCHTFFNIKQFGFDIN